MTEAEYDKIDAVRWSRLKALRTSALQYQHELWAEGKDSVAMRIGSAGHAFLLDPDAFEREFVCYKGERRGNKWKDFEAAHGGLRILTETEWNRALGAATAVLQHPVASQLIAAGLQEHAITWTDPETGLLCKGRVDHAGEYLVDLKFTGVIEPRRFMSHAARMGYHGQVAFYGDGLRESGFRLHPEPRLVVVQNEPPFDVVAYRIPEVAVDAGRALYRDLLGQLKACIEGDRWPGIAEEEIDLVLPDWIYHDEDLELTVGGEAMEF